MLRLYTIIFPAVYLSWERFISSAGAHISWVDPCLVSFPRVQGGAVGPGCHIEVLGMEV